MIDRRTMLKALALVPGLEEVKLDVREIPTRTRAVIVSVPSRPPVVRQWQDSGIPAVWYNEVIHKPEPEIDVESIRRAFDEAGLGDVKVIVLLGCDVTTVE